MGYMHIDYISQLVYIKSVFVLKLHLGLSQLLKLHILSYALRLLSEMVIHLQPFRFLKI